MSSIRIASRYAKSLIDLAKEQNNLERVLEDMKYFQSVTQENRDFYQLLKSPIISKSKKGNIFKEIFGERFDKTSNGFLDIILRKGRESYLPEIVDQFMDQYKAMNSISTIKLTTATAMSDEVVEKIKAKLQGSSSTASNIEIETKVNPDLIGGFVIEFQDKLFDSSVAHKLAKLRKEFAKNDHLKNLN